MREIKFRGFHKPTGKIIDLKKITPLALDANLAKHQDGLFLPFGDNILLEQYTGLKDKNGVEIYEGDVIRINIGLHYWEAVISTIPHNKTCTLYAVETFHNCTQNIDEEYTYERTNDRRGIRMELEFLMDPYEVIGNIHDNPELLK